MHHMKRYLFIVSLSLSLSAAANSNSTATTKSWRESIVEACTISESTKLQAKGLASIYAALFYVNQSIIEAKHTVYLTNRYRYDLDDLLLLLGKRTLIIGGLLFAGHTAWKYAEKRLGEVQLLCKEQKETPVNGIEMAG